QHDRLAVLWFDQLPFHVGLDASQAIPLDGLPPIRTTEDIVVLQLESCQSMPILGYVPQYVCRGSAVVVAAGKRRIEDQAGDVPRFDVLLLPLGNGTHEKHILRAGPLAHLPAI